MNKNVLPKKIGILLYNFFKMAPKISSEWSFPCEYQSIAGTSNLITEVNIRGNIVYIFLWLFNLFKILFFQTLVKYKVVLYYSIDLYGTRLL